MSKKQFKSAIESKKPHVVPVLQGWWKDAFSSTTRTYAVLCYIHGASIFASDTVVEELTFLREILETLEDMK
ncbi:MAG: hypothetical protein KAU21_19615 [Gammaproteobacteria bacterium]|nr:hypothetical protein [Gammaproteobacteria bacterium]